MSNLRQQDLPAEDLSDLGAPAARGSGLSGLLSQSAGEAPAAAPQPRRAWEPDAEHDAVDAGATAVAAPRRPRRPGRPRTRTKPVTAVYVSPGVKQRFEAYRHKQKATNLQVVLEAISSKHHELADIIKQSAFSTAPVNPLFPADPSAVRYVGGGSVQIGFSATPEQEQVLDRIGAELGFETRSTWIAPVLNAFLPGRKDGAPDRG
ncbi:hypothetical protein U8D42_28905 (plasmid) [Mycobacterium europaeum]|uniref:Uncharacterized protein n=2 Tax=Mycobacterium TaxID=1763 RepID=A0A1X1ZXG5_9MYCO|nr:MULTISPECIES: hypothetical protein [Mycobacterium]KLO35113.1 hypothetical protein ABW17_24620 [Mycobacterium nebraskense]ASL12235.1 hypothetical protein MYCODSM44623_05561 [Mycobacterium intracellulare subsp. chimaera]ASL18172.1 hypothetical protein MYCOZU2_05827 [Mycobacterium intracellulare subsp. chimaera]MCV7120430.1 hypothetical protein [Mycobacterium nebraskense]MCV7328224.1 hypothetical protein [Mycobacterium intracellulare subsp. chimaera]